MRSLLRPALAVLCATLALSLALPAQALSPNTSIIHYKPGKAIVGTLSGGVYTRTGAMRTSGWTDIAVGRDTLIMYRKRDGRFLSARFRNGRVAGRVSGRTLAGFSHVAAGCDTALFYNVTTGKAFIVPIGSGRVRFNAKRVVRLGKGHRLVEASCDTVILLNKANGRGDVPVKVGILENGRYRDRSTGQRWPTPTRLTATTDSFLNVDVPDATGSWGTAVDGVVAITGGAADFATFWRIITGSPDTLWFYGSGDNVDAVSYLAGGGYVFLGAAAKVGTGLTHIAAGK